MTKDVSGSENINSIFGKSISWVADQNSFLWLKALYPYESLRIKINTGFPDEAAYMLVLPDGTTAEFDDFPVTWSRGPLEWPGHM